MAEKARQPLPWDMRDLVRELGFEMPEVGAKVIFERVFVVGTLVPPVSLMRSLFCASSVVRPLEVTSGVFSEILKSY